MYSKARFCASVVHKSKWWMPWHNKTMKDVAICDKLRGGDKQPLIRRFPNGGTHFNFWSITCPIHKRVEWTWGSETSQYPEEKKITNTDLTWKPSRLSSRWSTSREFCVYDSVSSGERNRKSLNQYSVGIEKKRVFDFFRLGTLKGRPLLYWCSKSETLATWYCQIRIVHI